MKEATEKYSVVICFQRLFICPSQHRNGLIWHKLWLLPLSRMKYCPFKARSRQMPQSIGWDRPSWNHWKSWRSAPTFLFHFYRRANITAWFKAVAEDSWYNMGKVSDGQETINVSWYYQFMRSTELRIHKWGKALSFSWVKWTCHRLLRSLITGNHSLLQHHSSSKWILTKNPPFNN